MKSVLKAFRNTILIPVKRFQTGMTVIVPLRFEVVHDVWLPSLESSHTANRFQVFPEGSVSNAYTPIKATENSDGKIDKGGE